MGMNIKLDIHSKTSIYRAFIYHVPRFTGPSPFPPRGPVNGGFTVVQVYQYHKI